MPDSPEPFQPDPAHGTKAGKDGKAKQDVAPLLAELIESLALLTVTCEEAFMIACNATADPLKMFDALAVGIQMRILTKTMDHLSPQANREYLEKCSIAAGTILAEIRAKLVKGE